MSGSTGTPPVLVTLAEIARIAGVGRAAVSNWRRRHENFPAPVGGTDTYPQFSLPEVEAWLQQENKFKAPVHPLDRLWPEYEALGERDAAGLLVAEAGLRLSGAETIRPTGGEASDRYRSDLLERTLEVAGARDGRATFLLLLERWLRTHVRQITATPAHLAELMLGIAGLEHPEPVFTVLDPACGTGTLLAAAGRQWGADLRLLGQDNDATLTRLAEARLAVDGLSNVSLRTGDTLRADAHPGADADVVLCDPPSNDRDWGHAELATDPRWVYGQPPRTEPELAWVQHVVASLAPGGVAVLVLPPAIAARRAGRRIRSGLLRAGLLRAVIALPPGAAPPYGVGLHVWVLHAKGAGAQGEEEPRTELTLVDTARHSTEKAGIDWPAVTAQVMGALSGEGTRGSVSVPVIDLLDEQVDLTPARHIPRNRTATVVDLRRLWSRFDGHMSEVRDATAVLAQLRPTSDDEPTPLISVGELERAGAVEIRSGQTLPDEQVRQGEPREDDTRVVISAPLAGPAHLWLSSSAVAQGELDGSLTVTASQDVIVSVLARAFDVQVDTDAPSVLGPQLTLLRVKPDVLDPWFLAGCLRSPANVQQAGTHASTTSRVDVRRLQVPRLALAEQRRYGEVHRRVSAFEREMREMRTVGAELSRSLGDLLATGQLPRT
ncbi:N-6 DNA methylase [Streptomyces niveiscabiei]|uniref:N-6 DNA methylase n=1 Tax=Streptomyces niveiscabiei TaxID=164115 RepID=A0ABW9I144_9ACTN|nr:N-6 DNA methylase [Streptomyces niveiscabiei]